MDLRIVPHQDKKDCFVHGFILYTNMEHEGQSIKVQIPIMIEYDYKGNASIPSLGDEDIIEIKFPT